MENILVAKRIDKSVILSYQSIRKLFFTDSTKEFTKAQWIKLKNIDLSPTCLAPITTKGFRLGLFFHFFRPNFGISTHFFKSRITKITHFFRSKFKNSH